MSSRLDDLSTEEIEILVKKANEERARREKLLREEIQKLRELVPCSDKIKSADLKDVDCSTLWIWRGGLMRSIPFASGSKIVGYMLSKHDDDKIIYTWKIGRLTYNHITQTDQVPFWTGNDPVEDVPYF